MKGIVGVAAAAFVIACSATEAQEMAVRPESQPARRAAAPGGWWDDVFAEREVPLGEILAAPERWRGVPVSFVVQFRQAGSTEPSYFTRFEPDQWLGFAAWSDEAALWEKKSYDEDFRHLFVRRNTPDAKLVGAAAIYDRLALSGVVRDVIKGKPWIEVTAIRRLPEKITEGSLVHLVKGLMLRDHRRFDAAAREFEAADGDTLPLAVRLVGMREHAFALLNAKEPEAAEERLLAAMALDPDNTETAVALADLRERASRMPRPQSRPVIVQPKAGEQEEEPLTPGPPDPLADRPRRAPKRLPAPQRSQGAPPAERR